MLVGVPKEIKNHEYRVGLTPSSVRDLIKNGHEVIVQKDAGKAIDFTNEQYMKVGASIVTSASDIFSTAKMIVKVKEPQPQECKMLNEGQILFTYLHLAADPKQAKGLMDAKCHAIAYETITDNKGALPLSLIHI